MGWFKDDMVEETAKGAVKVNMEMLRNDVLAKIEAKFGVPFDQLAVRLGMTDKSLQKALGNLTTAIMGEAVRGLKADEQKNPDLVEGKLDVTTNRIFEAIDKGRLDPTSKDEQRNVKAFLLALENPNFASALAAHTDDVKLLLRGSNEEIREGLASLRDILRNYDDASPQLVVAIAQLHGKTSSFDETFLNDSEKILTLLERGGIEFLNKVFKSGALASLVEKTSNQDLIPLMELAEKGNGLEDLKRISMLIVNLGERHENIFYGNPVKQYATYLKVANAIETKNIDLDSHMFKPLLKQESFIAELIKNPEQVALRITETIQVCMTVFGKFAKNINLQEESSYAGTARRFTPRDYALYTNDMIQLAFQNPATSVTMMSNDRKAKEAVFTKAAEFVKRIATTGPLKDKYYYSPDLAYEAAFKFVAYEKGSEQLMAYCTGNANAVTDALEKLGGSATAREMRK